MKYLLSVVLIVLGLTACSGERFHLRGSKPLPVVMQQGVFLQGVDPRSDFGFVLRDGLEDAGATLKRDPNEAQLVLHITSVREHRTVSGFSSTRQVREFNHSVDVDFRVSGTAIGESIGRSVHAERSQVYDGKYVLGTDEEEDVIKDELRREAVRLIILRLQALRIS